MSLSPALAPLLADGVGEHEWVALLDRELRCVHLQRGLLGRVPETLVGLATEAGAADTLGDHARGIAHAVLEGGAARETEIACVDPRFGPRRFEFDFRPLRAADEVVGVLVRSSESTHRRSHARALRLQSRLLESMNDAVVVIDARRVIRFANPACDALFGLRPASLVGEPLATLGETFRAWYDAARAAVRDGGSSPANVVTFEGDGLSRAERVARCRLSSLDFDDERHDVVVIHDVTELQRLERSVVEAERRERERLARDMHDELGQELTAVALMLRALDNERRGSGVEDGRVQPMIDIISGLIQGTRAMASGIFARPAVELGLPAALRRLAQSITQRTGMPVECRIDLHGDFPLTPAQADHLYHVAQEATTNALRHAKASRIQIELAQDARDLRLAIRDDGVGLRGSREPSGLGLRIMQFRAEAAGGELRIEPDLPRGTRVEFRAVARPVAPGPTH